MEYMDIDEIIHKITVFTQDHTLVAIVVGLFIIFLLFRHPKKLLTIVLLLMAGYGIAWFFDMLAKRTGLG